MESQSQPQPQPKVDKPQTPPNERAEQLLALRAPLIERGKKVPALERSIAAHEVEANALHALLRSANTAEKVLLQERDEALREIDIVKLETDLVRERLRIAESQLAEVRDLAHVKEHAQAEELNTLRKRCSAMKRKIDYLTTGQKRELDNKIRHLENVTEDFRKEILEITNTRNEWRETAISTEQQLNELKTKYAKLQTVSALLETERILSASLRVDTENARQALTKAERENAKLTETASAKDKTDKSLQAEKEKAAKLRQKLKDSDAATKKLKRDESKLRQKCDDLDKRLQEALARAVKAEEHAAELEKRPLTTSRGFATPRQDALISPAPIPFGKRTAEDMASESRSRFTATLPQGIQDAGIVHEDESEEPSPETPKLGPSPRPKRRKQKHQKGIQDDGSTNDDALEEPSPQTPKLDPSPRAKRKKPKPQKLPPPRKTIAKRAPRRGKTDSESLKASPETKKRRQPTNSKDSNGPTTEGDSAMASPAPGDVVSPGNVTPRRKHGKATRKTTVSPLAKRLKESPQDELGSIEGPRRTLRPRRPVSYNYDEEGRDLVAEGQGFDVDYESLQPLRVTRSTTKQNPDSAVPPETSEQSPSSRVVSPSSAKRPRRMETVRKQVPNTRSGVK